MLSRSASLRNLQRCHHGHACPLGKGTRGGGDVGHSVFFHLRAAYRGNGLADSSEKQAQIVVDLRRSAHGGARVAGVDLLLYGDGRRQSAYEVGLGLVHLAEKLACVGRQALHIAPLTFGIEGVERQRRLAAAAQSGYDHKLVARDLHIDTFEVIDAHSFCYDAGTHLDFKILTYKDTHFFLKKFIKDNGHRHD